MPEPTLTPSPAVETATPAPDAAAPELAAPSDKEYSIEDFADMAESAEDAAPTPDEESQAQAETPAENEETTAETLAAPVAETPAAPKARDYSQFDPETTAALKGMSNKGFTWATKLLEQRKADTAALTETRAEVEKLKSGALPESWHSEPEAYKIAPQYAAHEAEFMKAQAATHQYAGALEALALGEAFDVPGSDGKPITIDPAKLDERGRIKLKTQLESARTHFYEQQRDNANAANKFRDESKTKSSTAEKIIVSEMERLFPIDPKTHTKVVEFEKKILEMFPIEFRNQPSSKLAARQGVYFNKLMAAIAEKDAKIKALEGLKADTKLAGGVPKRNGSAPAKGGDDANREYSLKDFEG